MHEASAPDASPDSAHFAPIPTEDRRRHPRYLLTLAITMEGENNFYSGLSENISEAGVFIATHTLLPIGTPVVLSFTLHGEAEPISVTGRVQWLRGPEATTEPQTVFGQDREAAASVRTGIGIQFVDVTEEARTQIRAFMQRRSPEFFD